MGDRICLTCSAYQCPGGQDAGFCFKRSSHAGRLAVRESDSCAKWETRWPDSRTDDQRAIDRAAVLARMALFHLRSIADLPLPLAIRGQLVNARESVQLLVDDLPERSMNARTSPTSHEVGRPPQSAQERSSEAASGGAGAEPPKKCPDRGMNEWSGCCEAAKVTP
jgi:hypothetical protein